MPSANAQRVDYGTATTTAPGFRPWTKYPNFSREFGSLPELKWQNEVQIRLLEYAKMPKGWDSYQAPPVGWDTGMFALSILHDVMRNRTPIPQVVPSSAGGVQLEWHEKDIDLELHITAPYQCEMWFQDHTQQVPPVSLELTDDYSAVLKPIELLTSR